MDMGMGLSSSSSISSNTSSLNFDNMKNSTMNLILEPVFRN
jgi:hypothetical protein